MLLYTTSDYYDRGKGVIFAARAIIKIFEQRIQKYPLLIKLKQVLQKMARYRINLIDSHLRSGNT